MEIAIKELPKGPEKAHFPHQKAYGVFLSFLFLFLVFTFSMSPHFLSEERKKKEILLSFPFSSVHSLSCGWLFVVHTRLPCPSPTPRGCPNSCPSSWWCHPTISSSVVPFSSRLQSFPATGSFPVSQFFASGGQSIAVSASTSVLPVNIQDWFPLGWTGWISLQSKGLSSVFSNTTVQKHQFFNT